MKVLISGAGIAGTAATLFLKNYGIIPTVIDKADSFQKLGYILSLKSFGIALMGELGLLAELKRHELRYSTFRFYDAHDRVIQEYNEDVVQKMTNGEMPLYRAELHEVLFRAAARAANIAFGLHIRSVEQRNGQVHVGFSDGTEDAFDILIVAEGVRSSTRRMVWQEEGVDPFDVIYAAATIEGEHGFAPACTHSYFGLEKNLSCLPVTPERLVVQCYLRGRLPAASGTGDVHRMLLERFGDFPSRVTRMLSALNPDAYIFRDNVEAITLPSLNKERIVFLGDAGYCPTFLSGMGASLALLGARVLAQCIVQSPADPDRALAEYSASMRAPVMHYQNRARKTRNSWLAPNRLRLTLFNWLTHITPPSIAVHRMSQEYKEEDRLLTAMHSVLFE